MDTLSSSDDAMVVEEGSEEEVPTRRRSSRDRGPKRNNSNANSSSSSFDEDDSENDTGRRRSGRANKYKASMKVPGESVRDLYRPDSESDSSDDEPLAKKKKKKQASKKTSKAVTKKAPVSPPKSRGQHNNHRRRSQAKSVLEFDGSDNEEEEDDDDIYREEEYDDDEEEYDSEPEDAEDDETMKIQRIIAVRSETRKKWREICASMQTSEVTDGSRWFQPDEEDNNEEKDSVVEERFLVKWNQLSYLHVSWETHGDLMDQVENAKNYMSTFFRKQVGGRLFGQEERKDGDYFNPGLMQTDWLLEAPRPCRA